MHGLGFNEGLVLNLGLKTFLDLPFHGFAQVDVGCILHRSAVGDARSVRPFSPNRLTQHPARTPQIPGYRRIREGSW